SRDQLPGRRGRRPATGGRRAASRDAADDRGSISAAFRRLPRNGGATVCAVLVVPAYAKLNLALEVVRRRGDGWHEIASVVVIIDWHDLVGLSVAHPAGGGTAVSLRLDGPEAPAVPDGGDNLAKRAAAALLALTGRDDHTLDIWLDKRIP